MTSDSDSLLVAVRQLLEAVEGGQRMLWDMQLRLAAIELTLSSLDSRAAATLSEHIHALRAAHEEELEKNLKQIALLRAAVSSKVQ